MTPVERDDFAHALGQTLGFYGKDLDKQQFSFWLTAMGDKGVDRIKPALLQYTKVGKYAPKPVDILEIIEATRAINQHKLPPPKRERNNCPPEIQAAWMWFINRCAEGSENFDGIFDSSSEVPLATQEKYLHLVNHEARANNQPDAIPDEYKLSEVWG